MKCVRRSPAIKLAAKGTGTLKFFQYLVLQTKTDVAEMEPVQRNSTEMERQDPTKQRNLALLAHAM